MAEPGDVSYDRYCAHLADFRSDLARFREEMWVHLAGMRQALRSDIASVRVQLVDVHAHTVIWLVGIVATGVALTVTLVEVL